MIRHLDLFSGIGGFALAIDKVFGESEHIFCEIDGFCQAVLKRRFKGSIIYGDIRGFTANAHWSRLQKQGAEFKTKGGRQFSEIASDPASRESRLTEAGDRREDTCGRDKKRIDILTGGFPCQPFSAAGKRRGTSDNRYLWPEMFRVIKDFKPTWVVAENVRGLLNIEGGMVFEQVLSDLEAAGYEVRAFVIPACAVNAPHRRDRVWIVAHAGHGNGQRPENREELKESVSREKDAIKSERSDSDEGKESALDSPSGGRNDGCGDRQTGQVQNPPVRQDKKDKQARYGRICRVSKGDNDASNARSKGLERRIKSRGCSKYNMRAGEIWHQDWFEVATILCGVDDGLPAEVDGLELSKSRHRIERLKALGNSIVPQVVIEIFKAIRNAEELNARKSGTGALFLRRRQQHKG